VIAITGSNGKTTTKEILSGLLSDLVGEGVASHGSYNNEVGVPLTILAAGKDASWLVLEMGMNHPGELTILSKVGVPDAAVILNIAPAHIGNFDSIAQIADAKCEITAGLKDGGALVIPDFDNNLSASLERKKDLGSQKNLNKLYFGSSDGEVAVGLSKITSAGIKGIEFQIEVNEESQMVTLPLLGEHNAYNVAAAVAVISHFFSVELEKIVQSLARAKGARMRLEVREYQEALVINDAYNANPTSVEAAFKALSSFKEPLIVVLGDMGELGEQSADFHKEVGRLASKLSPALLVAVGDFSEDIIGGARSAGLERAGRLVAISSGESNVDNISRDVLSEISIAEQKPVILIKGSRAAGLEQVVEYLDLRLTK